MPELLSEDAVAAALTDLPGWERDGDSIVRTAKLWRRSWSRRLGKPAADRTARQTFSVPWKCPSPLDAGKTKSLPSTRGTSDRTSIAGAPIGMTLAPVFESPSRR